MKFLDKVGVTYWTSKLKSYVNTKIEDLKNLLSKDIEKKQDKLTAGDNIQIDSDTISVIENTDKRFVSDSEKSIWNGKQDKLTAGENITITNNKISATDTVYTHPDKHKPSEIETDANNRFVTDEEKNTWTGKQDKLTAGDNISIDSNNKISAVDTKYTHPTSHSASMITETTDKKFMTSAEKNKLDGIATNANYYTHPTSHPASMITESTTKRFVSDAEKTTWTGKQDKLAAGTNVSISGTTISATDTTYELASASANGLMSSAMFSKVNGLYNMVYLTESAYEALGTKDPNTLYLRY